MASNNEHNKVYDFFYGLSKFIYIIGGPNFWPEELRLPTSFTKIHKPVAIFVHTLCILVIVSHWGALYTQTDLTEKQIGDLIMFTFSHSVLYCYLLNAEYYAKAFKELFKYLAIDLKSFIDKEIDRYTTQRIRYFSGFCTILFCSTIIMYGVAGLFQVLKPEGTFTTLIIAWPDVNDNSKTAGVVRILIYIVWWIFVMRTFTVSYLFVIPVTICLSHQFKVLRKYFHSLNDIFEGNDNQKDKEQRYEEGFKIGIRWHADILRCVELAQKSLDVVIGGQITINITLLSILLLQFVNMDRVLANTGTIIVPIAAVLFSTGCFMWNAGDITVEASTLSMAMYASGWHNCRTEASLKVRSMVTIAMWQSQRPVQLLCLGLIQVSYESYVTIVKCSYSLFSMLY